VSKCKFVALLFVAALILRPVARADVILDSSVTGSAGAFSYAYEIENQTDVGILLLSLTVTGDVGVIQAPTGWLDTTSIVGPGETLVEWVSTDTPYDVPAMGSLSGFVIASDSGPGTVPFSTFDENAPPAECPHRLPARLLFSDPLAPILPRGLRHLPNMAFSRPLRKSVAVYKTLTPSVY
jgi:hypothetical protein